MFFSRLDRTEFLDLVFLTATSSFFLLFGLGQGSLINWDEAIYAAVAKEILQSGDWIWLRRGGELWFDKPPLAIWATAVFYKLFGISEFSSRVFSALCGIGTVLATYFLGRNLFGRWTGFLGALVLASSFHFIHLARMGMLEVPLSFFVTLSLYFFWLGQTHGRYFVWWGVFAGLAVMTKSFAAFSVFFVSGLYCLSAQKIRLFTSPLYWAGLGIASAIVLPWHFVQGSAYPGPFMRDVVHLHFIDRAAEILKGHFGNYLYYLHVLLNRFQPWFPLAFVAVPVFFVRSIWKRQNAAIFLSLWMFIVFLIFSLTKAKLPFYIVQVYPALSISIGYVLAGLVGEKQVRWVRAAFVLILVFHIPLSHIFRQDPARDFRAFKPFVDRVVPPGHPLYLYQYDKPGPIVFYLDRSGVYIPDKRSLLAVTGKPVFYCFLLSRALRSLESDLDSLSLSVLESHGDLVLIGKRP